MYVLVNFVDVCIQVHVNILVDLRCSVPMPFMTLMVICQLDGDHSSANQAPNSLSTMSTNVWWICLLANMQRMWHLVVDRANIVAMLHELCGKQNDTNFQLILNCENPDQSHNGMYYNTLNYPINVNNSVQHVWEVWQKVPLPNVSPFFPWSWQKGRNKTPLFIQRIQRSCWTGLDSTKLNIMFAYQYDCNVRESIICLTYVR